QWVLYFASPPTINPNYRLDNNARCIGVATARTYDGPFVPQHHPLICPPGYQAHDNMATHPRDRNRGTGVIGPQPVYATINGEHRLYLVYKTQELPATIRLVRLNDAGTDIHADGNGGYFDSDQLLASAVNEFDDTLEAPAMVQRGSTFVLFTAKGTYTKCSYSTGFYRSDDIWDWSGANRQDMPNLTGSGICGPGTADVTIPQDPNNNGNYTSWMYLNGWVCNDPNDTATNPNTLNPCAPGCPPDTNACPGDRPGAKRVLYIAVLDWDGTTPRLDHFIQPN
ncbi:MAG: hypothetical protein J2P17_23810, partial [Mycobacterium sp.]|nr:hypothetical protein [Mycobacterium sp.]